ncbi:hypothetical protein BaRGS_00003321 [Batillaria attramentaria]|uniref:C-type lectin domain-containing protein n=1 Tax=Batillaria attramentaria TaxID=370345 RepID=A0ABD0M2R6_9CAEN
MKRLSNLTILVLFVSGFPAERRGSDANIDEANVLYNSTDQTRVGLSLTSYLLPPADVSTWGTTTDKRQQTNSMNENKIVSTDVADDNDVMAEYGGDTTDASAQTEVRETDSRSAAKWVTTDMTSDGPNVIRPAREHYKTLDGNSANYPHTSTPADDVTGNTTEGETSEGVYFVNVTACVISKHIHIPVVDGYVLEANGTLELYENFYCRVRLLAPEGRFVSLVIEKYWVTGINMEVWNIQTGEINVCGEMPSGHPSGCVSFCSIDQKDFVHNTVVAAFSPNMQVEFQSNFIVKYIYLRARILVTTASGKSDLQRVKMSPNTGYVTNLGFDGHSQHAEGSVASVFLDMTEEEGIMISFPHFHLKNYNPCVPHALILYEQHGVNGYRSFVSGWSKCGTQDLAPMMFKNSIKLRFFTDIADTLPHCGNLPQGLTGFKMFYSIHPTSTMPQQLDTGMFNCSVPHYTSFSLHFDCNLETECRAGEDERNCDYTSDACGPGFIDAGNICYRYVTVRNEITWLDAEEQCRSFGERLVSPRTPSEWQTFRKILEFGKKTFSVYVGLSTSPSNMAAMYRDVWQWTDQTMAFYINIVGQKLTKPTCAYIPPIYRDIPQPVGCVTPIYVSFLLCEKDKVFNKTSIVPVLWGL